MDQVGIHRLSAWVPLYNVAHAYLVIRVGVIASQWRDRLADASVAHKSIEC